MSARATFATAAIASQDDSALAAEARSNLSRFDEIDNSHVAQREVDMRASAERYQTQGKGGQGQFSCTFRCKAGSGEVRGPYSQRFSDATRNQAENEIKRTADELCRRMYGDGAIFKNVSDLFIKYFLKRIIEN